MKKQEDIIIGNRIRKIRTSLQMDQKQFSEIINTTVSALSNWENGRNKPNMEKLKRIAQLADISVEELLYGTIFRQRFNEYWTQLINNKEYCINNVVDTSNEYCINNVIDTSNEYFIKNVVDTSKEDYKIDQKEFEYIKSNKEKLYDIFYKNILEYGYNDNDNNNIRLFKLSVYSLLKEYYISQEDYNFYRATTVQTVSKAIEQITITAVNAGKQTTNIDDKTLYLKLVEITEEYAMQIDKLFKDNRQQNDESTL